MSSPYYKKPYKIHLNNLSENEIFGEEDFILGKKKRNHSIVIESAKCEIILIKKRDFFLRIYSDEGARKLMLEKTV